MMQVVQKLVRDHESRSIPALTNNVGDAQGKGIAILRKVCTEIIIADSNKVHQKYYILQFV